MRRYAMVGVLALALVSSVGCTNMSKTQQGLISGTAVGAAAGAGIAALAGGYAGWGALIGAGGGAIVGGLIGHGADESDKSHRRSRNN